MEIKQFIQIKKEIYSSIMNFIDTTGNADIDKLIRNLEQYEILKDKGEIITTLQLLSKVADNHHRLPDFMNKLSIIIQYLLQTITPEISDYEIYQIFENNKRILLLLLEEKFIKPNKQIISNIMKTKDKNNFPYSHYLYSGIKSFINGSEIQKIEKEIIQKYDEEITNFEEKCRIGENDSYICSLIRQDSAEKFISYVNQTNTSLSSQIQPSIFETNLFLMQKTPTLIEYASFFGSIQIIQYLRYSNVSLTNSMCLYFIHSNNAELFHFLEENEIKLKRNSFGNKNNDTTKTNITYEKMYEESILCHHNFIADFIKNNFLDQDQTKCFEKSIIYSCNYNYFTADTEKIISRPNNFNEFYGSQLCPSLTKITIPSSVTSIGNYAFSGWSSLAQIIIPSSMTSIGNYAFRECSSLSQITFETPSSVIKIGSFAFFECSSLTQIIIPSSVTSIGSFAFSGCTSLKQITFDILSSMISIENSAFSGCSSLTHITIPSSVTSIEKSTFSGCSSLTQITIPSSVTSIRDYAFYFCSSLTKISIPSSVTSIGDNAFYGCSSLSAKKIKSINSIKSNSNIYKKSSKMKYTWKPESNHSNNMISPMVTKNNYISWVHNSKPHNMFYFGGNISNEKSTWNSYSKSTNQNAFSWITNNKSTSWSESNDKKSGWIIKNPTNNDSKKLALKTSNTNPELEDKNNQKLIKEFEIMKMLDHPNVLKAVDIIYDEKKIPSILYEKCSTNLKHVIQNKIFSKVRLVYSIFQIAEGMKYIHSHKIVHLNLNPTNILILEDGTIKISDFKNAEKITSENKTKEIDDVYSFGKIVYFILSGREINDSEKESVLESFSLLARQLIEACFLDAEHRPTFEMICDVLAQNNFNLISLSQQEIEDLSKLIN